MPETNPTPHEAVQRQAKPPSAQPLRRRGYERLPETQRQIEQVEQLDTAKLIERASPPESDPGALTAEALVYFIRRANQAGDSKTRDALFRSLLERCTIFFRSQFRGATKEQREDLMGDVLAELVEDILSSEQDLGFMEARFWRYLKMRCIDAYRKSTGHSSKVESLDTSLSGDGENKGQTKLDQQEDKQLNPEEMTLLTQGLGVLPHDLRQLFLLRHAVGMKIGADNPSDDPPHEATLARHFKCTGRTIRNRLKEADRLLASFREKGK
ncbi:hypothetical protein ACOJCM_09925 [Billgrantia sp. LNSP4103-1]|uniref:hypothetical protein n=1 Tax=Billgrantia sp. LNSP4103-1 TaxID=3410266 RepID=UPI00403F906E